MVKRRTHKTYAKRRVKGVGRASTPRTRKRVAAALKTLRASTKCPKVKRVLKVKYFTKKKVCPRGGTRKRKAHKSRHAGTFSPLGAGSRPIYAF